jgi:hypothetical protein
MAMAMVIAKAQGKEGPGIARGWDGTEREHKSKAKAKEGEATERAAAKLAEARDTERGGGLWAGLWAIPSEMSVR